MTLPSILADGFEMFQHGRFSAQRENFLRLAMEGQAPEIMVISCCDSGVPPEIIFDADPGQLFVVRNVANLVPPSEMQGRYHGVSAAIEFAVLGLKIKHIVVLGHSLCGGVRAYLDQVCIPDAGGSFIGNWMSLLAGSRDEVLKAIPNGSVEELQTALEKTSIKASLSNLRTFQEVRRLENSGCLSLHGCHFDIGTALLTDLPPSGLAAQ